MKFLLIAFVLIAVVSAGVQWPKTPEEFAAWLCGQGVPCPLDNIPATRTALVQKLHSIASEALATPEGMRSMFKYFFDEKHFTDPTFHALVDKVVAQHKTYSEHLQARKEKGFQFTPAGNNPYPYFAFIPSLAARVAPNGQSVAFSSPCFRDNVATATLSPDDQTLTVLFQTSNQSALFCSDNYLMGSMQGITVQSFYTAGEHIVTFNLTGASPALMYDIKTKGIRVFMFVDDVIQLVYDLLDTVVLFLEPAQKSSVDDTAAQNNLYFLSQYSKIQPAMQPRNSTVVQIPADYIQSGDFIGVIRLDGLDPMLAWAMGSTTGHTVIALRAPNNTLFFCESTINDSYWPTNGIQCTEYDTWVKQAVLADHNVVVAPLNPTLRANFNATAAWQFFESTKGLDYGYHNMLFGWIDTLTQNYPCLPPNYDRCLTWDIVEVLFGFIDTVAPSIGDILFNQALNLRMNTTGLLISELLMLADQQGIPREKVPAIVEQDNWVYKTTRYGVPTIGKSQVCCVFVCNMWKAGGVFGNLTNQINCGEQTNFDDYSLNLFDPARIGANRPAACLAQDPTNQLCQIVGKYTLNLNGLNTRQPYAHMDESCPSLAPAYNRPSNC